MIRFLILLVLASTLSACKAPPPEVCQQLQDDPLDLPLSFATYEEAGRSADEWRTDLRNYLRAAVKLPEDNVQPPAPVMTSDPFGVEQVRTEFTVESLLDGAPVPYAVVEPDPSIEPKRHLVMLLHGHGETWDAPFEKDGEMHDVGGELLDEGYAVVTVEIRSFGDFKIDGKGHDAYLATVPDGEFIGQVVADTVTVALTLVRDYGEQGNKVSILGHSLGGYASLHVGALTEGLTSVMSSGFFVPYACIDTDYHHQEEAIKAMIGVAEFHDTAGLMSPEATVDLFFGGRDLFFTVASLQMYEHLVEIFEKTGAPTEPGLYVNPELGHEIDTDHVIEALSKF